MKLRDLGLYLAWMIAVIATSGSLYFSEVRHFIPCTLCWYQRILMYPLVILLGIASFRNDKRIIPYVLPMSLLGLAIATYHVLEQNIPGFGAPALCSAGIPCNVKYINWLGFISIPVLSLSAFSLVSIFLLVALRKTKLAVETRLA